MSEPPPEPSAPESAPRPFRFKAATFERANVPLDSASASTAIDVHSLYRSASGVPDQAPAPPPAENEVHAILRANLARANAAGSNDVVVRVRRPSRRNRDYWLLLAGGNLTIIAIIALISRSAGAFALGITGMVFYSMALTWVMRFIMEDY